MKRKKSTRPPKMPFIQAPKSCKLCADNVKYVDFKNLPFLQRFVSHYGQIDAPRRSGCCATHQRMVAQAIKKARIMGLLPFTI